MANLPEPTQPPPSSDDILSRFDSVPLFMQSLPKELGGTAEVVEPLAGGKEGETNPSDTLAALQALAYDGDPSEIAENFRTQGNDLFKRRKFRDAIGFYTRALDEVGRELPVEERRTLRCNRAAANLELSNYGACLRDCSLVLSETYASYPDPPTRESHRTTMKALLRSARALSALDKLAEAMDAFERLRMLEREVGEEEADVGRRWRDETVKKVERRQRREREDRERERRRMEERAAMVIALTQRGVVFPRPTAKQPLFSSCPTDVTPPHFDPDVVPLESLPSVPLVPPSPPGESSYTPWRPPPPQTPLVFPAFLLLPLASPPTRDLIMSFPEDATFGDALASMGHDPSSMQLYLATRLGRVLKIGSKMTLGKVLVGAARRDGRGEVEDGWALSEGWALEMVGVPRGAEGDAWVQRWKDEVKAGAQAIL